ncbi:MAG: alpha/beta hydrolase, partial [Bdellovibrio sp.]|nr:alpha/beta hydrolase [Bdellovibrio sp.]
MKTPFILSLALIFFSNLTAMASFRIPTSNNYESGRFLCEQKFATLLQSENGFYTTVPADYKNPKVGTTDVYAFYYGGFDPAKETIL